MTDPAPLATRTARRAGDATPSSEPLPTRHRGQRTAAPDVIDARASSELLAALREANGGSTATGDVAGPDQSTLAAIRARLTDV